jgi:arylsulfatase A-like enzyme
MAAPFGYNQPEARVTSDIIQALTFMPLIRLSTSLLLVLSTGASLGAAERPNILLIFSDDHAYQSISTYGTTLTRTPHIDQLAVEGVRFDRCYVTNSLCGPSRACILTGKYSHKNGFYSNRSEFDGSQQTMPKLLRQAGYQTAVIGKWHLVSDPTGFDHWEILPGQGRYYSPVFNSAGGRKVEPGYVTDVITDKSLRWLREQRDPEKPFLLMVQHKAPHREWSPGPSARRRLQRRRAARAGHAV